DLPLQPELAVLTPQSIEFLALCCRQAAVALAGVTLRLCQPVPDRLCRRLELTRQLLRRAAGAHQLNHLAAELRRVGCSCLAHRGLLKPKIVRCPRNRGNFIIGGRMSDGVSSEPAL